LKDKKKHKAVVKDKRKKGLLPEKKEAPKDEEWEDEEDEAEEDSSDAEDEDEDADDVFFDMEAEESEDEESEGEELGAVRSSYIVFHPKTAITDTHPPRPHQQQHS